MTMYKTVQHAFVANLKAVMLEGNAIAPRGMETRELLMHSFKIAEPAKRMIISKARGGNPFAQMAEAVWVLAGRNDLDWLETYIPQCKKWSDDGKTWRAGYGPRLRQWNGVGHVSPRYMPPHWDVPIDQIRQVYNKLRQDPDTRQAVITLWDPAEDWVMGSKDYPCNNWLHFIIRNHKLHLNVVVRSNDAVYGFSHADFFIWSILQDAMASWLNVGVGTMTWNTTSFHVYERHYDKAYDIIREQLKDANLTFIYSRFRPMEFNDTYNDFHYSLDVLLDMELQMREGQPIDIDPLIVVNEFSTVAAIMFWLWYSMTEYDVPAQDIAIALRKLDGIDMGLAATYYMCRKMPELVPHLVGTQSLDFLKTVRFV